MVEVNQTKEMTGNYLTNRDEILADASLMRRLRDIMADDIRFYERWVMPL